MSNSHCEIVFDSCRHLGWSATFHLDPRIEFSEGKWLLLDDFFRRSVMIVLREAPDIEVKIEVAVEKTQNRENPFCANIFAHRTDQTDLAFNVNDVCQAPTLFSAMHLSFCLVFGAMFEGLGIGWEIELAGLENEPRPDQMPSWCLPPHWC